MSVGFLLLLLLGTAFGATHVNISIGHNPADVAFVGEKESADLKEDFGYRQESGQYSAKLQLANGEGNDAAQRQDQRQDQRQLQRQQFSSGRKSFNSYSSAAASSPIGQQYTYQQYNQRQSAPQYQQQRQSQNDEHEAQNQEFERYIQKFQTGPTVETVYETSSPAPLRVQQQYRNSAAFSPNQRLVQAPERSNGTHKFERIIAVTTMEPPQANQYSQRLISNLPKANIVQQDSSAYGANYDRSYNAHYGQSSVGDYSGSQAAYGHYRPAEQSSAFSDVYTSGGGGYSQQSQGPAYPSHPLYQEMPVSSPAILQKTIHVAQPALKARTFEIRRPAIQKQFYDIEERVLVKPAGTVVVELDHPVAKIHKGETIVPIGIGGGGGTGYHHTSASSSGGYFTSDDGANGYQPQYSPPPVYQHNPAPYNPTATSTIGSHITTTPVSPPTPSVHSSGGTVVVDTKSFADGQFSTASSTTTERTVSTTVVNNTGYYGGSAQGSQQSTPFMVTVGEPDFHYPPYVEINSHGSAVSGAISKSDATGDQSTGHAVQAAYVSGQQQEFNRETELLNDDTSNDNSEKAPARLQLQPHKEQSATAGRVLKQEHNIHVPPAHHTIVLGRLQSAQQQSSSPAKLQQSARYEQARVQEIKPYLKQHPGPVVVYATASVPVNRQYHSAAYTQEQPQREFKPKAEVRQQPVQYSASYTQQRIVPDSAQHQAARYSTASSSHFVPEDNQRHMSLAYTQPAADSRTTNYQRSFVYSQQQQKPQPVYTQRANERPAYYAPEPSYKSSRLTAEETSSKKYQSAKLQDKSARYTSEESAQTKIHIQVPIDTPADKSSQIIISSTLAPATAARSGAYRNEQSSASSSDYTPEHKPQFSARYESQSENYDENYNTKSALRNCTDERFGKLVEAESSQATQSHNMDASLRSDSDNVAVAAHVATPGSRVIAATPAPNDDSGSESFHARRIVVNHPFQTVREVVEHVPVTNYHQVTVNEPHTAALYRQYQGNGNSQQQLRSAGPVVHSPSTHGNLQQHARYQTEIADHGFVTIY